MMKAVVVEKLVGKYADGKESLQECLKVKEVPIPVPSFMQVLVKVQRAQINPSDTSFVQGRYGKPCELGSVPGFECCGTVVGHGGSPMGWFLMNKRVATFGTGCWAEYVVCDALSCFDVGVTTDWRNCAGAVVNPMTVIAMYDLCKLEKVVVCTAGTSSLVGQFIRYANARKVKTVAIVRHQADVALCQNLGALVTLNSSEEDFALKLKQVCEEHKVRVAFDSVAGEVGTKVFQSLMRGGELHVYGFLSGKPMEVAGGELIFKQKVVKGLWLNQVKNVFSLMRMRSEVIASLNSDLTTTVRSTYPLNEIVEALMDYTSHLSGGKVQLIIGDAEQQQQLETA